MERVELECEAGFKWVIERHGPTLPLAGVVNHDSEFCMIFHSHAGWPTAVNYKVSSSQGVDEHLCMRYLHQSDPMQYVCSNCDQPVPDEVSGYMALIDWAFK